MEKTLHASPLFFVKKSFFWEIDASRQMLQHLIYRLFAIDHRLNFSDVLPRL